MPNAKLLTTILYVVVHQNSLEIPSHDVHQNVNIHCFGWKTQLILFLIVAPAPVEIPQNPCQPSPCGPNSDCREINGSPSCSCLPEFLGTPPNCRPECVTNSECSNTLACINRKCKDPCIGMCGQNAHCRTVNHIPICMCNSGFLGDPFILCNVQRSKVSFIILLDFFYDTVSFRYDPRVFESL